MESAMLMDWRRQCSKKKPECQSMNSKLTDPIVLAIDADPISLAAIRTVLDCQGCKVHTAQDHLSATEIGRKVPLDLIICELNVAGKNGIDLLTQIRELPGRNDVPVMFVSANQAPDVIRRTHEFGAAYHLRKPFDPQVLTELVQRAMWMPHLVHNHLDRVNRPNMPLFPTVTPPLPLSTTPNSIY